MNARWNDRLLLVAAVTVALIDTGCARLNQNSTASTAPGNTKVNPAGPFPIVGRTVEMKEMKDLGYYYRYAVDEGRLPKNLDDLGIKQQNPKLYQLLVDKGVVIFWNVNLNTAAEGSILAYNADVPTKGGIVLMTSGVPQRMTVEEFNKTPKAVSDKRGP